MKKLYKKRTSKKNLNIVAIWIYIRRGEIDLFYSLCDNFWMNASEQFLYVLQYNTP